MVYEERLSSLQATAGGGCSVFGRFHNMTLERRAGESFLGQREKPMKSEFSGKGAKHGQEGQVGWRVPLKPL